ncbi:MAG: LysR family transcriptional regulator [Desulfobacter sp.]|nr:MAG: LysR family transcriptional regulator [Desulfobacter sp.]
MLPDLNRIKAFYYIYHHLSVAQAAREMNISPSAVSQALAKLEGELKLPLFTRLHRKLVPTTAGRELFDLAAPLIRELDSGVERIIRAREVPSGPLRIGSPIEFGKSYFPRIFAAFRQQYPEVVFTLVLGDPSEIFAMIGTGELDFGLVDVFLTKEQMVGDLGRYSIEPLIDEEVILGCSKTYYDRAVQGDHSFANLVSKEFISYRKGALTLRNWFKHHFKRFPGELNRVMTVDSHQAVINGILNHLGMGVIATHIVESEIDTGEIIPVQTERNDVINKISLAQLQDKIPSLTERTFIRFMKADISESGISGLLH